MSARILTLLLLFAFNPCWSQKAPKEYDLLTKKADSLFKAHDFKNSAELFSSAFKVYGWKGLVQHRYKAASAWAMSSQPDSAFSNLKRIVTVGKYSHYGIRFEDNFKSLHNDIRWMSLMNAVRNNELEKALNSNLARFIDSLANEDQKWRSYLAKFRNKQLTEALTEQEIKKGINRTDSLNYYHLKSIFNNHGYPNHDLVGEEASHNYWLLIQHQDAHSDFQNDMLAKMKVELDKGKSSPRDYAYLIDRVYVNTGKLQIYGTQMQINAGKTSYECKPVIEPDKLNERRKSVGLEPIENYIVTMNTIYFGMPKAKK